MSGFYHNKTYIMALIEKVPEGVIVALPVERIMGKREIYSG